MTVTFDVLGIPAPQGSKSAFVIKGTNRAVVTDGASGSPKKQRFVAWRDAVASMAQAQGVTFDEPVVVSICFRLPLPKSDPYRTRHFVAPDIDKLVRSTLDGMIAGGLLRDDALVCELHATKDYARHLPVGASLRIDPLGDEVARDREQLKADARLARD